MTQRLLSATRMLAIPLHTRRMPSIYNGVLCAVRMRVPEEVKDERKYSKNGKQGVSAALSAAWNSFCRRFLIHPPARKTEALLADYSLTIWSIQGTNHSTHFPLDAIITLTDVYSCAQRWPVWWPHRGRRTASESCSGATACGARSTRCWPSTSR